MTLKHKMTLLSLLCASTAMASPYSPQEEAQRRLFGGALGSHYQSFALGEGLEDELTQLLASGGSISIVGDSPLGQALLHAKAELSHKPLSSLLPEGSAEDVRARAIGLSGSKRHRDACPLWQSVFDGNPKAFEDEEACFYYGLSLAFMETGDKELAERLLLRYLKIANNVDPEAYGALAHAMFNGDEKTAKTKRAAKYYESYLSLQDPQKIEPNAYGNAFQAFHNETNYKAALKCFKHFLEGTPTSRIPSLYYVMAANCAEGDQDSALSSAYWKTYFSLEDPDLQPYFYACASLPHKRMGAFDQAIAYLEQYFGFNPTDSMVGGSAMNLGLNYAMQEDYNKACLWYDRVFKNLKQYPQSILADLPGEAYILAATAYLMIGKVKDAEKVMVVYSQIKQGVRRSVHLDGVVKKVSQSRASASKKGPRLALGAVKAELAEGYKKRFETLFKELKLINLKNIEGMDEERDLLERVMAHAEKLKIHVVSERSVGSSSGSSTGSEISVATLYTQLACLEKDLHTLQKAQTKATAYLQKERAVAYYRSLGECDAERMLLPVNPNIRSAFGHVKSGTPVSSFSRVPPSSSSTETQPQTYQVSFHWLKNAEKQYQELQRTPGLLGTYHRFMEELSRNPVQLAGASGRPKLLQGETGYYARRFDKGNRLVYHVKKTETNTFEVTLCSLLGHYKQLAIQQKAVSKKLASGPKRTASKSSTKSKKTRKT